MTKKPKKKEDWMGFYGGRIPKKLIVKPKKKPKKDIYECFYCSNKSSEGNGVFIDNVVSSEPKSWVCSPCIKKQKLDEDLTKLEPKGGAFATMSDDDDDDDPFSKLSVNEILEIRQKQKDKNIWLVIFGVIIIAIILSLVERSRIFSVVAVVALVAVFLLYRYEVKI